MTKTVDGVVHTYLYAGGKLLRETYGNTTLDFFYDANGNPFALKHNNATYYYITNLQGDVLLIVDAEGETVAEYTYDPYGKVLTATGSLASVNPLRYRGYYYDTETGFYYLQSRYYDPTVCRFINADDYASTGQGILGHNMFAYCGNNPICQSDQAGTMADAAILAASNFWNPLGWVSTSILVIEIIIVICVVSEVEDISINQPVSFASEHTKNKRPSTKGKHEKGQSRKQRDQGGEKKEHQKGWKSNKNKRNYNSTSERKRVLIHEIIMQEML